MADPEAAKDNEAQAWLPWPLRMLRGGRRHQKRAPAGALESPCGGTVAQSGEMLMQPLVLSYGKFLG